MEPGEIYWADLGAGRRPVIVVSREDLNRGNDALVVLCTTQRIAIRSTLPNCVGFQAGDFGMPNDCVAQCEAIYALEKPRSTRRQGRSGSWMTCGSGR